MSIVNEGIEKPHSCDRIYAEGRPSQFDLNIGAIWECPKCGKFWQMYNQSVSDYEGDFYGYERRWRQVLNAKGEVKVTRSIDQGVYISRRGLFWSTCVDHGKVSKGHLHYRSAVEVATWGLTHDV